MSLMPLPQKLPLPHLLVPAGLVLGVTCLLALLADVVTLPYVAICYLVPVAVAASHWGGWSAAATALMGAMATAYFFYPPILSLWVDNPQQKLDLALFGIVAAVVGYLVLGIRANAKEARLRAAEVDALHRFTRRLAVSSTSRDIYSAIQDHVSMLTHRRAVVLEAVGVDGRNSVSLSGLPEVVVQEMHRLAADREAPKAAKHVSVAMPNDLPLVEVDSLLIEQALGQILDNARKYSPKGTDIAVAVCHLPPNVVIAVTDNGMGMTVDEHEKVWDRFYRSPRVLASVAGSGLGL